VIIRREVLGDNRFDTRLKTAEDRDLWATLVSRTPIYLQSDLTATLIELEGSLSHSDLDLDCQCMLRVVRRHQDLLGVAGVRRWEASVYRRWAATYLGQGNGGKAILPALRRLRYQPLSPEAWWVLAKSSFLSIRPASHTSAETAGAVH